MAADNKKKADEPKMDDKADPSAGLMNELEKKEKKTINNTVIIFGVSEKKEKDAPTLGDLILDNIPIFEILVGLSIFAIYNRFTNHG